MHRASLSAAWRKVVGFMAAASLIAPLQAASLINIGDQASQYFAAQSTATADVVDPWLARAVDLQNKVDYQSPLATATFLMTHNSYNASAYRSAFAYYDPNQRLSITQQLQAGVRSLELDVHRFFSMTGWPWQWRQRLLLCHGQDNHLGCSPYDRPLEAGIDEIKRWLETPANAREVLVIYIEDHIDGRYADLVNILVQRIGNRIYRPQGTGCQGIPMQITKQHIVDSGKQVLLMGASEVCTSNSGWNTWAYAGVGDRLNGYPTGDMDNVDGIQCEFDRAFYDRYWVRFYEDRTVLSGLFADPDLMDVLDAANLQKCGVNLIGFDKLRVADERLHASIWSWERDQPSDGIGLENCVQSSVQHRFDDRACAEVARYACVKPGTHEWRVTESAGTWDLGADACATETAGEYHFAAPTNGYDNERLREAKLAQGAGNVWIDLQDQAQEGRWQSGSR